MKIEQILNYESQNKDPIILFKEGFFSELTNEVLCALQIYKLGYDILLEIHRYVETMPRTHRYTVGERLKNESIELSLVTYQIGKNSDVNRNKLLAGEKVEIIRLLFRLMVDLKRISQAYFVAINRKLEHLYLSLT